ncbi:MAG: ABC-type transport auxiliary lipoprotein family protein [Erythrobacter sp.]
MMTLAHSARAGCVAALATILLGGCSINLTSEPPASLLTLQPTTSVPVGTTASVGGEDGSSAIAVLIPEVPAKLNVARIPVTVNETEIAYLQDAFWIERPARLFRQLLGESLRAKGAGVVLDNDDTPALPARTLRGTLLDLGYDAPSSSVVVRYNAVKTSGERVVETRRFEAREGGVLPDAASVGPALNRVANEVANDAADWMLSTSTAPSAPPIAVETAE